MYAMHFDHTHTHTPLPSTLFRMVVLPWPLAFLEVKCTNRDLKEGQMTVEASRFPSHLAGLLSGSF